MSKYTEIFKLKEMLERENIEFEFTDDTITNPYGEKETWASYHICCPNNANRYISVIQGFGTYGESEDLLEIMGLLTNEENENDSVIGHLSAEEVMRRIKKHKEENNV